MSIKELPTTGESKVYDSTGRTKFPKDVMREFGIEEGDEVKWVLDNGELTLHKVDEE